MHNNITTQRPKPGPKANYLRIIAMLAVLAVVAAVALLAYDEYEPYYEYAPVEALGDYIYESEHGYEEYSPYPYGYEGHEYSHEYYEAGYEYDGYEDYYSYEYEYDYDEGYDESGYDYDEGGYIGYAPDMHYYDGPVSIEVDDDGNLDIYPPGIMSDAVYAYDYLLIRFPMEIYAGDFGFSLPYGWTYTVSHDMEERFAYIFDNNEYTLEPTTFTLVRIRHILNDNVGGYIGFQPFALNAPGHTLYPGVNSHLALVSAITTGVGDRLVAITDNFNQTMPIAVPAGRSIIIASQGTNFQNNMAIPPIPPPTVFTITRPNGSTAGRHFTIGSGATLTVSHITLDGGTPAVGINRGGIFVSNATLNVREGTWIQNNRSADNTPTFAGGGGVRISNGSTLNMTGGTITANAVQTFQGGGVQGDGSTFNLSGGTISNNEAQDGGGVRLYNNSSIIMTGGTITGNRALTGAGGGLLLTHSCNGTLSSGTISYNRANNVGGGISISNTSTLDITGNNVNIYRNTAPLGGGGIAIWSGISIVTMTNGHIHDNRAPNGGGVWLGWSSAPIFNMHGGTISNNRYASTDVAGIGTGVISEGGGVWVSMATVNMTGGTIGHATDPAQGNRAGNGGGVWLGDGATFTMQQGGTSPNFTNGIIVNNQATNGGGVYATSATITMSNSARITNNLATSTHVATGGGGGTGVAPQPPPIPIVGANPGPSGNGGGIHATNTTITMNNSARIDNNNTTTSFTNEARPNGLPAVSPPPSEVIPGPPQLTPNFSNHGNGGGIFITGSGSTLTMNHNIRIDHNSAAATLNNAGAVVGGVLLGGFEIRPTIVGNGGGIFASDNAVVQITPGSPDVQIYRNRTSSTASGYAPTVNMINPTTGQLYTREEIVARRRINMPITAGSGAGAFIHNGATFHMPTGVIHTNTANASSNAGGGAGVFVNSGGTLNMSNNALIGADAYAQGNRMDTGSGGTGAGVFVNAANVHMTGTARISFNLVAIPQAAGGGMHVAGASVVTMSDNTRINNNIGGLQGGGVNMLGGNFTMSGNAIIENNHVVAGNSGGGVNITAGFFTMTSPTNEIRNHTVGATPGTAVISNQYIRFGAGVQVSGTGHFRLLEGRIHSNRARQFGAGVRIFGNGRFDMHGGEITDNQISPEFGPASGGAGVFVETAAPTPPTMAGFNMMDGRIHNNAVLAPLAAANDNRGGGGVRVNTGFFRLNGGEIENNRVYSPGIGNNVGGGGVYMAGGIFFMGNVPITPAVAPAPPSGATYGSGTGGAIRQHNQTPTLVRGGGVFLMGTATFNIGGGTDVGGAIYNNIANYGGGIYVTGVNAQLNIGTGALVETNRAQNGGGVNINNSIVNMTGGDIRENRNQPGSNDPIFAGGGVRVTGSDAIFTMSDGMIGHATNNAQGNRAINGGGVWTSNGATFNMQAGGTVAAPTRGTIAHNSSTNISVAYPGGLGGGGGVNVNGIDSTFNMSAGIIRNNASANYGGGLTVHNGAEANMSGGEIHTNTAVPGGGGVFVGIAGTEFNMSGGVIYENTAASGGGLQQSFAPGSTNYVNISGDAIIRNNTATTDNGGSGNGGGLWFGGNSISTISDDVIIRNNVSNGTGGFANGGGGIWSNGILEISDNVNIHNNTAVWRGGGILGISNSILINNVTIEDNRAPQGGGMALTFSVTATMHNGSIVNNRFAGTIPATGVGTGIISEGGGVWVDGNGVAFTMHGGTIGHATNATQGNRALSGGGVWVGNSATFNMTDYIFDDNGTPARTPGTGQIINNEARNPVDGSQSGGFGGGVRVENEAQFTLDAGSITNNRTYMPGSLASSGTGGGGVHVTGANTLFTMNGGTINGNTTDDWGGGVNITVNGAFIMNDGSITGNHANRNVPGLGSSGGGVWIERTASFTMHGGEIYSNIAEGGGGGVGVRSNFTMTGGVIRNNIIAQHGTVHGGGGVLVWGDTENSPAIFNMSGGYIRSNTETVSGANIIAGGGVHVQHQYATFTMTGGVIGGNIPAHANTAGNGGGVWVGNEASFYMLPGVVDGVQTHGTIMGNTATNTVGLANGGGGVHVTGHGSEFTMRAGVIGGDAGSGESNTATRGGGVHVSGPAIFRMEAGSVTIGGSTVATHGHISGNIATGATASDGGGGVFMFHLLTLLNPTHRAQFFLEAGVIGGNSNDDEGNTGQHGGGVFIHSNGTMTMSGGRIIGNRAIACGGGINLGANIHDNNLIMTGGIIGGGIDGEGNTAGTDGGGVRVGINSVFEMEDGRIIGNKAVNGGGVVVLTDSVFNMRGGSIGSATNENEGNSAVTGGGVSIGLGWIEGIATATSFNMYGGTIGNNTADYGGGVYVNDNVQGNVFNLRGTDAKVITANEAEYDGGGVWVAEDAEMIMQAVPQATNVSITHNTAGEMGGGIFTERHEYANPLTRYTGSPLLGAQTVAYSNLTLHNVIFNNNQANRRYVPPINALNVLGTGTFNGTSIPATPTPIRVHPLNNYDINFHAPGILFEFHKTNQQVFDNPRVAVLLPGARFKLFRASTEDLGGTGSGGLVPADITGTPWEEVTDPTIVLNLVSTNLNNEPISFYMTPGFIYQLVEYMAPSGYQIPMGQWRIRPPETIPNTITLAHIEHIGGLSIPGFIPNSGANNFSPIPIDWFLGNRPDLGLPLTGGLGTSQGAMTIGFIGLAMMVAAGGLGYWYLAKQKKRRLSPVVSRGRLDS